MELVHTYLCGPTRVKEIKGEHYFSLFIDDYTRMTLVFFLKKKCETFECFEALNFYLENENNQTITCLRSNNGEEFISN